MTTKMTKHVASRKRGKQGADKTDVNSGPELSQIKMSDLIGALRYLDKVGASTRLIDDISDEHDFIHVHPKMAAAIVSSIEAAPEKPNIPVIQPADPGKGI